MAQESENRRFVDYPEFPVEFDTAVRIKIAFGELSDDKRFHDGRFDNDSLKEGFTSPLAERVGGRTVVSHDAVRMLDRQLRRHARRSRGEVPYPTVKEEFAEGSVEATLKDKSAVVENLNGQQALISAKLLEMWGVLVAETVNDPREGSRTKRRTEAKTSYKSKPLGTYKVPGQRQLSALAADRQNEENKDEEPKKKEPVDRDKWPLSRGATKGRSPNKKSASKSGAKPSKDYQHKNGEEFRKPSKYTHKPRRRSQDYRKGPIR